VTIVRAQPWSRRRPPRPADRRRSLAAQRQIDDQVLTVVHLLPRNLRRGAQIYCAQLVERLDGAPHRHHVVLLRGGDDGPLSPSIVLEWDLREPTLRARVRMPIRLHAALQSLATDVVVVHGSESLKAGSVAAPRRVPVVYLRIDGNARKLAQRHRRFAYRALQSRCAAVVGVSDSALEAAQALGGRRETVWTVIPNGRDPAMFTPRNHDMDSVPHLVFVGALDANKRPDIFVEVVRRLRRRGTELRATVVGTGPDEGHLAPAAEAAGVTLSGPCDDVPLLLTNADLLLFTSQPPEGLPGILIEAGMAGIPVIASDLPGARDVVVPGRTGLLVPHGDIDGFARAVEQFLGDPRLRRSTGERARTHCSEHFDLRMSSSRWNTLLEAIVH
jgi:glycosyltransferase involved in cell wall biosynthesis